MRRQYPPKQPNRSQQSSTCFDSHSKWHRRLEKAAQGVALSLCIIGLFVWADLGTALGVDKNTYSMNEPEKNITDSAPQVSAAQTPEPQSDELARSNDSFAPVENYNWEYEDIIGLEDILSLTDTITASQSAAPYSIADIEQLRDFDNLRAQFYVMDTKETGLLPGDVDAEEFMEYDFLIDLRTDGPKVLIFHTHAYESYADSDPDNPQDTVVGLGAYLAEQLRRYGIEVIHDTTRYDTVNGKMQLSGAYERAEENVRKILRDNPSVEIIIDLHRDGVRDDVPPMVAEVNGLRTARIMFVNGMCRIIRNGSFEPAPGLVNPFLRDNLAFSFRLQYAANTRYPGFMRKIYLKPYRYSTHMLPKSILVEIGAQNNTKQEAYNAIAPLADIIADVVLP